MNDLPSLDAEELIRRVGRDVADSYDEEIELETEDRHRLPGIADIRRTRPFSANRVLRVS